MKRMKKKVSQAKRKKHYLKVPVNELNRICVHALCAYIHTLAKAHRPLCMTHHTNCELHEQIE